MSAKEEQPTGQVIASILPARLRHRTGDEDLDALLCEIGEAALHQWGWQAEILEFPGRSR